MYIAEEITCQELIEKLQLICYRYVGINIIQTSAKHSLDCTNVINEIGSLQTPLHQDQYHLIHLYEEVCQIMKKFDMED